MPITLGFFIVIAVTLAGALPTCAVGQGAARLHEELLETTKAHVIKLSEHLRPDDESAGIRIDHATKEQAVSDINREIDGYLGAGFDALSLDIGVLRGDLARILAGHSVRSDYGDPPSAFVLEQQRNHFLLVSYALSKGGHGRPDGTAVGIRAYQAVDHQLKLLAATGDDLDGTFAFIRELHSPLPNEKWLLAWGTVTGSNGFGVSVVRVYAFDGQRFRTVWSPADFQGATAEVTQTGFTLRHVDKQHAALGGIFVEDRYELTPDGVRLVLSTPVLE